MSIGKLVQIGRTEASSSPSVLTVTGIASADVHLLLYRNCVPSSDDRLGIRITKSGSVQSDSNYDNGRKGMPSISSFQNNFDSNDSKILLGTTESTGSGAFGMMFLYKFNDPEFSYISFESSMWASTPAQFGEVGAGCHTVASGSDGISFFYNGGSTFSSGEMILYKVL